MPDPTTPSSFDALTLDQFRAAGVEAILDVHPDVTLNDLRHPLRAAAELAEVEARHAHAAILKLMSDICSMMLQPAISTAPLAPFAVWGDGTCSMGPEHLHPTQIDFIAGVADIIAHQQLRARLGDLVWLNGKRHGNRFALRAIDDYRDPPIEHATWLTHGRVNWHRALQLAASQRSAARETLESMVADLIAAFFAHEDDEGTLALWYLRPLEAERLGKAFAPRVAAQLSRLARREADDGHAFHAAAYVHSAINWFEWTGDTAGAADMQALLGGTWERHGDKATAALARHAFYQDAIVAYRSVPGRFRDAHDIVAAIERSRLKYEQAGRDAVDEMDVVKIPAVDVTDLVRAATEHVHQPDALKALYAFCELDSVPVKAEHTARAQVALDASVVARLFGSTTLDSDGRAIVRTQPPGTGEAAGEDPQVAQEAMRDFVRGAEMVASAMLAPALDQIRLEHNLTINDFRTIALRSGVVPRDRASIVGKALYAGYCHDLEQALHILMPQFEHIVRQCLKTAQAITATHDDGIDMEVALSS